MVKEWTFLNLKSLDVKFTFTFQNQLRNKLNNSALLCIFLDYDYNPSAFCTYDITNNKIVISCAVVFFEDSSGNCNALSSSPDFLNLIPYYEKGGSGYDNEISFHNNNNIFIRILTIILIILIIIIIIIIIMVKIILKII